jgi:hypothetical protein
MRIVLAAALALVLCGGMGECGRDRVSLTVAIAAGVGNGTGSVTSSPPGIACPGNCSASFDRGTVVTLMGNPDAASSDFRSWSTGATGSANPVMVTMDSAKNVIATFTLKQFQLAVTNTPIAGASGTLTSLSVPAPTTEISCGSTCTTSLVYNTTVTLTATPTANFYFGGWSGDCSGPSSTCSVTMTAARNVTVKFTPANYVFATANTYTISTMALLGTGATMTAKVLDGADKECQSAASTAGLANSGSFVAWLSASMRPAPAHIPATARGWVRKDGRPFTDTISALTRTYQVFYPPVLDENGTIQVGEERVWSATLANGAAYQASAACSDYTSTASTDLVATGERAAGALGWTNQNTYGQLSCDKPARLYCFGTTYYAVVPAPALPTTYRYAFLSSSNFDSSTGLITGADSKCGAEKRALPGSYKALLAPAGATPASRFTARGVPVVRPDGVLIADTDTALFANTLPLRAPIDVESNGIYSAGYVFTGATSPAVAGAATCNNWADKTNAYNGTTGFYSLTLSPWFNLTDIGCGVVGSRIYCLQE